MSVISKQSWAWSEMLQLTNLPAFPRSSSPSPGNQCATDPSAGQHHLIPAIVIRLRQFLRIIPPPQSDNTSALMRSEFLVTVFPQFYWLAR